MVVREEGERNGSCFEVETISSGTPRDAGGVFIVCGRVNWSNGGSYLGEKGAWGKSGVNGCGTSSNGCLVSASTSLVKLLKMALSLGLVL